MSRVLNWRVHRLPRYRAVLVICGVPLPIGFHDDVLYILVGFLKNLIEVAKNVLAQYGFRRASDSPINYEILRDEHFLADWTQPSCGLLHHRIPGIGVEAL